MPGSAHRRRSDHTSPGADGSSVRKCPKPDAIAWQTTGGFKNIEAALGTLWLPGKAQSGG